MLYQEFVLQTPLNTLITICLGLAFGHLICRLSYHFEKKPSTKELYSLGFALLALISILMLTSVQIGFVKNQTFSWLIKTALLVTLIDFAFTIRRNRPLPFRFWKQPFQRYPLYTSLVLSTLLFMFLISLSPPTDADSLRYHLGFPAKALYDGLFYRHEWIHGRLFGYGELVNMFGLFFGTDSFGSFL